MLDFPSWKVWLIALVAGLGVLFAVPNFFAEDAVKSWPSGVPRSQLSLGLDLRGGSHLMLEAQTEDVRRSKIEKLEDDARAALRDAGGGSVPFADLSTAGGQLSVTITEPTALDRAVEALRKLAQPLGGLTGQKDLDVNVVDGNRIVVTETDAGVTAAIKDAMDQAVEVVRKRIDELGTREPTIVRQGENRIVVQVPGLQNPAALKALLGKTAKLEFKEVVLDADPALTAQGRAPPGAQVLPFATQAGGIAVRRRAIITGDQLTKASVSTDDSGRPATSFQFDGVASKKFAKFSAANIGKPFAIVLDNRVISAPTIQSAILGGSGIITGGGGTEEANNLAILLRSGKLPVQLKVIEERTVGPDLGADSIRRGAVAASVAVLAVSLLMILTYGRFGVYAVAALVINIFMILGIMSLGGFTLTLPGIAGLVLTIGAAVDANVLINERIREEQRKGRGVIASVEVGYRDATRTIWDANSLNIIVAIIMFLFGSGPIKGFAVVLSIGIATSVFTAVTVTRLMVATWLRARRPQALAI